ncbi:MAG TPA: MFS transporter [Planctomycetaceae bacterium]|jgi:ACS family tartrate transporter-like MFS transporter|nr:MFS transporter [Planctomycetaceae bacterium]
MRKVTLRLIPFLLLLYICNLLDRNNVAFTKLAVQADVGMTGAEYGFGAGLFYFGYLVFEVPSNLIMRRTGARVWISRIVITWGLVSGATMLVTGFVSFFTVRILLGVAEAGFFPGIIYYLTYWFPAQQRTRALASFMAGNAVAGIITNPLSGTIIQYLDRMGGLHGWQWVFLLESLPSVILGVCALFYLTDRPDQAQWLAEDERSWLAARMRQEEKYREERHGSDFRRTLTDPRVWLLILLYFMVAFGANAGGLFLPELIRNRFPHANEVQIGFIAAAPSVCGLIAMLANGAWADRTGKHRLHVAIPGLLSSLGWVLAALSDTPAGGLVGLSVAMMCIMCMLPTFWALPTSFLSGAAAAGGIALINSVGNIGGLLGPGAIGLIHEHDKTGSYTWGLLALAAIMFLGGILAFFAPHDSAPTGKLDGRTSRWTRP